MPVKKLNLYVRPDERLEREAAEVGELLARAGIETFPRRGRILHATLFMTDYPAEAEGAVLAAARKIRLSRTLPLVTNGLRATKDGWIFLELERTPELVAASMACAEVLAPLRDPHQAPPSWMAHYTEKERSFNNWGSPNVGDAFEPHFTLVAKAPAEALARVFGSETVLSRPKVTGAVRAIALGEADDLGQISRELAEI